MKQISISNITIDVVRKDIKNIHLAVYPPTGRVRLAAPLNVSEDTIRLFAISKITWIKRNQRKFEGQERMAVCVYKQRESHYLGGQRYLLNVIEQNAIPKVVVRSKTYIDLYIRPNTSTKKREEIMTEWYRAELKKLIPTIIEKWEKTTKIRINGWQVKLMKTKWGSCNIEKKKIWINLELIHKPLHCLEYIVLHEMVHLIERHHNEKFQYYMDRYMPNWKNIRAELNKFPVSHADWEY